MSVGLERDLCCNLPLSHLPLVLCDQVLFTTLFWPTPLQVLDSSSRDPQRTKGTTTHNIKIGPKLPWIHGTKQFRVYIIFLSCCRQRKTLRSRFLSLQLMNKEPKSWGVPLQTSLSYAKVRKLMFLLQHLQCYFQHYRGRWGFLFYFLTTTSTKGQYWNWGWRQYWWKGNDREVWILVRLKQANSSTPR